MFYNADLLAVYYLYTKYLPTNHTCLEYFPSASLQMFLHSHQAAVYVLHNATARPKIPSTPATPRPTAAVCCAAPAEDELEVSVAPAALAGSLVVAVSLELPVAEVIVAEDSVPDASPPVVLAAALPERDPDPVCALPALPEFVLPFVNVLALLNAAASVTNAPKPVYVCR